MDKEKIRHRMNSFIKEQEIKTQIVDVLKKQELEKKPLKKNPSSTAKHAEYFEGQLQLRRVNDEVLSYIHKKFHTQNIQVPIQKVHSQGNIDYWVSSKKLLHKLAKELKNKFGGISKESEQLFSFDHLSSKNIYRLNVYYEMHKQQIGDILSIEDEKEPHKITGFKGERIVTQNCTTLKKGLIEPDKITSTLQNIKSKIVTTHPSLTALDDTFTATEVIPIKNETYSINQNVKIVKNNNSWFIV